MGLQMPPTHTYSTENLEVIPISVIASSKEPESGTHQQAGPKVHF